MKLEQTEKNRTLMSLKLSILFLLYILAFLYLDILKKKMQLFIYIDDIKHHGFVLDFSHKLVT
jgi:hypothetical protein